MGILVEGPALIANTACIFISRVKGIASEIKGCSEPENDSKSIPD